MQTITGLYRKNMMSTPSFGKVAFWNQDDDVFIVSLEEEVRDDNGILTNIITTELGTYADKEVGVHYDPATSMYVVDLSGNYPENGHASTLRKEFLAMNTLHDKPVRLKD